MKRHVITISGNIASGKSEVSKRLANLLSYELYKASDEFRRQAREKGMTLVEFNEYLEDKPELDIYVDKCTSEYVKGKSNIVVDARLGFFFVKDAFDVFLKADTEVASKRLFLAVVSRGKEEEYTSEKEAKEGIVRREQAEKMRYFERYGIDITNMNNYTCVIDTTNMTSEQVTRRVLEEYNKWLKD